MKQLMISDVTLRMQQRRTDAALSFKEKLEIAKLLDRLRPDAIELAPIADARVDSLLAKSVAGVVTHSRLVLPVALSEEGVDAAWRALSEARRPRLQIAVPTSAVQMEYLCHKKPAAVLDLIGALVSRARALCDDVEFVAEDATRSEEDFLCRAVEAALSAGSTTVTLSDTAGLLLPQELAALLSRVREAVPALSEALLGVQCADALHLAPACAIAAAAAGADLVKTAVAAEGQLSLEALCELLRVRGADLGLCAGVRTTELGRTVKQIDWILHTRRSATSPFDSGVNDAPRPAQTGWALDENSSQAEVADAVKKLGYDLSEEDGAKVFDAFRHIAAKKAVGEKELDAIIASAALQVPPTYALESYVVNSGNVITATAHLRLQKNGTLLQGVAVGDGPIDAAFLAIEQITGHHYELDDFQIQAVTEGREAMGASLIRLRSKGRLYAGNGISTDIIGASIRAYLSALNKIVYEEGAHT